MRLSLPGAAALIAALGLAGAWSVLRFPVAIDGNSGDWRGVSTGLRRSRPGGDLHGGARAVIHVRGLPRGPLGLELRLSALPPAAPVEATVRTREGVAFAGALTQSARTVSAVFPPHAGEAEVWIEAASEASPDALFRIHGIVLSRPPSARGFVGLLLPPLVSLATLFLLWRRAGPKTAVGASLVAAALVVALWIALADPVAGLRFRPAGRERLCLALLGAAWIVAAASPRLLAVPTIVATVGLLYLPSLGHGFVFDDFAFARPWSLRELLSTLWGSWDPVGLSTDYFRPLASATLALDYRAWGAWPPGFHLTNLALHAALGCLLLLLLHRLGLPPLASLAGALAGLAHPLGATAAAWVNQRSDTLAALFYVAALALLVSVPLRLPAVLLLVALALASKEVSVTWPLLAALTLVSAVPRERRLEPARAVRAAALLTAAYLAYWIALFPGRIFGRLQESRGEAGLEAGWRAIPAFFATVFAPVDYVRWWQTPLGATPPLWLCAGVLLPLLAFAVLRRCRACDGARLAGLGLLWPVLTALPMLGMSGVDVYGKGLLLCVGFSILWGLLVRHAQHRSLALAIALAVLPVPWLAPLARAASAAWGPGGFFWERNTSWMQGRPDWKAALTPEMRELFRRQREAAARDERWVRSGSAAREAPNVSQSP